MKIYLAGPYTHPDEAVMQDRHDRLTLVAGALMQYGLVVFSPISHTHTIAKKTNLPTSWEFWKAQDIPFLIGSDALYVLTLDGWEESMGVAEEIEIAKKRGIQVLYIDEDLEFHERA